MEVILLDNVGSLGVLGDRVDVKPGYGRNFLIPQGKAVPATQENIEKFEVRRAELEAAAAATLDAAQKRGEAIQALEGVQIAATAGEEGKLFGSVGTRDIAEALTAAGCETDKAAYFFKVIKCVTKGVTFIISHKFLQLHTCVVCISCKLGLISLQTRV